MTEKVIGARSAHFVSVHFMAVQAVREGSGASGPIKNRVDYVVNFETAEAAAPLLRRLDKLAHKIAQACESAGQQEAQA